MHSVVSPSLSPSFEEVEKDAGLRIKAPFLLTLINDHPRRPLFWLWSRRFSKWVVELSTQPHRPVAPRLLDPLFA